MFIEALSAATICLALNIYHEARGEPYYGQAMVGIVTLNRAEWKSENVCNVVYSHKQFSWTLNHAVYRVDNKRAWANARGIAGMLLRNNLSDLTTSGLYAADHYHADYISPPAWAYHMERLGQVGRHIFYKER
jgi:spore germination cell wall hydrolase CwlJ-like protein